MHVAIRSYAAAAGLIDGLTGPAADSVRKLLREIPGFQAYYLVKTGDAEAISVSVYDDEAGTAASTVAARDWIAANLPELKIGPPQVASGEVALHA